VEFIYRELREWLEGNKDSAFTKEDVEQLETLIKRLAD